VPPNGWDSREYGLVQQKVDRHLFGKGETVV